MSSGKQEFAYNVETGAKQEVTSQKEQWNLVISHLIAEANDILLVDK